MESSRYQNVPRTIQNIFLNQSLESRVIKDIVIDSMDFSDGGINLDFYREHVKDFRQQYEDIWKWYRREKNGQIRVQVDAERVISSYTLFEGTRKMVAELCGELVYALDRDQQLLPLLDQERKEKQEELDRKQRLLCEEEDKHEAIRDRLIGEEAQMKSKLDTITKKRLHYQEIHIENIRKQMAEENVLNTRKDSLKAQMDMLAGKDRSVKEKYESLKQQEDLNLATFKNQLASRKNDLDAQLNRQLILFQEEFTKAREDKQDLYRQRYQALNDQKNVTTEEKQQLQLKQLKIRQLNPYQEQMEKYRRKVDATKKEENELNLKVQQLQRQVESMTSQTLLERGKLETECELDVNCIEQQKQIFKDKVSALQDLLDRQKGSFIEWLSENVDGWEHNFGKVLDEETVLFNGDLSPKKSLPQDSIFGVQLNLDNIDRTVRTPKDVLHEKTDLEQQMEMLNRKISDRKKKLEEDIRLLESKPARQIKELRQQRTEAETELRIIPVKITQNQKAYDELSDLLVTFRKNEMEKVEERQQGIEQALLQFQKDRESLQFSEKRSLDQLQKEFRKQCVAIKENTDSQITALKEELKAQQTLHGRQLALLDEQMDAELKGFGVDVKQLATFRRNLNDVMNQLRFIEEHRRDFIAWQNDQEEYFDHEQEFRDARKLTQEKRKDLEERFSQRHTKYTKAISTLREALQGLQARMETLEKSVVDADHFIQNGNSPVSFRTIEKRETARALSVVLNDLRDRIGMQLRQLDEFKQSVMVFKKNFSPQNTFHFRTEFNVDTDYIEFATDLNEFLSNHKIEEYRLRTSNVYLEIIRRISREVNDLMSHRGKIESTISEINKDFKENNFAGVIKDIELRSVESNDPLMQLLLNINRFVVESNMNLGEVNLFSDLDTLAQTNQQAVELLMNLMDRLELEQKRDVITLADTFKLEFKVRENDNDTGWVEKLSNVGSDGTDILVKAMVNIMLINVFKRKVSRKFGDFRLHCLMDEIGKLHPNNVKGILDFANKRNIYLINSSPTTYTAEAYRYTYLLSKDARSNTLVRALLTIR
jgi:hypothetical protein